MPSQPVRRHACRNYTGNFKCATTCSASPARRSLPTTRAPVGNPEGRTTEQAFGDKLHTYTIVDAINDKNSASFRASTTSTRSRRRRASRIKGVGHRCRAGFAGTGTHHTQIVGYIREHFDQKTKRSTSYRHDGKRLAGFTSLFATHPSTRPNATTWNLATAKDLPWRSASRWPDLQLCRQRRGIRRFAGREEEFETEGLDQSSRDFSGCSHRRLQRPVRHQFRYLREKFQNYYKDLSQRLKKRELDLVIVVNMFPDRFRRHDAQYPVGG